MARFDGFITVDQNLQFQQNVKNAGIAVVVLIARTNRLKELLPLASLLRAAVASIQPGEVRRVGA